MLTFSREQQLASSDSRIAGPSSEFIPRIDAHPPKALSILVGLAVLEVQGSPKCTSECIVPVMRPSLAFEHCSQQPAFQTSDSAIHLSDTHPGPRVRCSFGVGKRKGAATVVVPPPTRQLRLTLYLCFSLPRPHPGTAVAVTHS